MKKFLAWWREWRITRRALAGKALTTEEKEILMKRWNLNDEHFSNQPWWKR